MSDTLKFYQSIKKIHAEPMTLGEFNSTITNLDPGKLMDPTNAGYHVVYSKGLPEEYHSWSPKSVFDEGYLEIVAA